MLVTVGEPTSRAGAGLGATLTGVRAGMARGAATGEATVRVGADAPFVGFAG